MTKLNPEDITIEMHRVPRSTYDTDTDFGAYHLEIMEDWGKEQAEQLKAQILENFEKAEKWDKVIESQTFDFEPIDDVEEITRQLINNEIRTTHKLYEQNKQLKYKVKELEEEIYHKKGTINLMELENQKDKDKLQKVKELVTNHNCRGFGCINCEKLKEIIGDKK